MGDEWAIPEPGLDHSGFQSAMDVDLDRPRREFGGRSLQQEYSRTLGMVRSPAQDRVRKMMGEAGFE